MSHPVSRLDRLIHGLLWCMAAVLIPLAVLVGIGRELMPLVAERKPYIEEVLSARTGFAVRMQDLQGDWHRLNPVLRVSGLSLADARAPRQPLLTVPALTLEPDWWASLRDLSPRLRTRIEGLELTLSVSAEGKVEVRELAGLGRSDPARARKTLAWVLAQPGLTVLDSRLHWLLPDQSPQTLLVRQLTQYRRSDDYRVQLLLKPRQEKDWQQALLVVAGDPMAWRSTPWQLHLDAASLAAWQPWWQAVPLLSELRVRSGRGQLWLDSEGGLPVRSTLQIDDLAADVPWPAGQQQRIKAFRGTLALTRDRHVWRLGADNLQGRLNDLPLPFKRAAADYDGERLLLNLARVDLQAARALALRYPQLPAAVRELVLAREPAGVLPRLQLRLARTEEAWSFREASAEFKALQIKPTATSPGFSGLGGWLQAGPEGGLLYLDTRTAVIDLHTTLREPLRIQRLQGGLRWYLRDRVWHVDSGRLDLATPDARGHVQLAVQWPLDRRQDARLDLLAGIADADVASAWRYVPWHAAGDKTLAWLQKALVGGKVPHGTFLYSGTLFGEGHSGRFDMRLGLSQAHLDYVPGWPAVTGLDGEISIIGRQLLVTGQRATVMGARATHLRAEIADLKKPRLSVSADLDTDLQVVQRLLTESPIRTRTAGVARALQMKGPSQAHLALEIPLGREQGESRVRVEAVTRDAELTLPGPGLTFTGVNGPLVFDRHAGLSGTLRGQLWEAPAQVVLGGQQRGRRWWRQQIQVNAPVSMTALAEWSRLPLASFLRGSAPASVQVDWPVAAPGQPDLRISSTLEGVQVLLPAPLGKPAARRMPLLYQGKLGDGEHLARATLTGALQAGLAWKDGRLHRALLRSGYATPAWPEQPGIFIDAKLAALDLASWQKALAGMMPASAAASTAAPVAPALEQVLIQAETVQAGDVTLGPTRFRATRQNTGWMLRAQGLTSPSLPAWPATEVSARLQTEPGLWRLEDLQLRQPQFQFNGSLGWTRTQTTLRGDVASNDLRRLLSQLGQDPALHSENVSGKLVLQWPGSPQNLSLDTLQGSLQAAMQKGRLVDVKGINVATRLFGLLNASNILRRLRLDFSDVTRKGINFDRLTLQGQLQQGVIRSTEIELDGPSVTVRGKGWVNLKTHEIDQHLRIGIPVSSAVPVVAGLLAGPVVGGALVAADLLLDKRLARLTSVRYHVSGRWEDPRIVNETLESLPTTDLLSGKDGRDAEAVSTPAPAEGGSGERVPEAPAEAVTP